MATKNRPPKALLTALQNLFDAHGWDGTGVLGASVLEGKCGPGQVPIDITEKMPDGRWVTRTICVPLSASLSSEKAKSLTSKATPKPGSGKSKVKSAKPTTKVGQKPKKPS